jgi:hypothetical protein
MPHACTEDQLVEQPATGCSRSLGGRRQGHRPMPALPASRVTPGCSEIPQLFWFIALLIASNGTDSRVGSRHGVCLANHYRATLRFNT